MGSLRVRNKAKVCGYMSSLTKHLLTDAFCCERVLAAKSMDMASAAAVDSSNKEALAISMPLSSMAMV